MHLQDCKETISLMSFPFHSLQPSVSSNNMDTKSFLHPGSHCYSSISQSVLTPALSIPI